MSAVTQTLIELMNSLLLPFSLLLFSSFEMTHIASAKSIELTPADNWFAVLSGDELQPGDEVVLQSGVYSDSRRLVVGHSGTAGKPITIRAAAGQTVIFRRPDATQNTFNLEGNQHLQIIGLEITGGDAAIRIGPQANLSGDDGTSSALRGAARQPSDILLQGLHIHHIGGVAITCNHSGGQYQRMIFRANHIHHTASHGEGLYQGGNEATAIMSDSIIENNYIHHLNGDSVSQGDGIEIKQGSFGNRVVGNVIHDTNYPGITIYGTQGHARNVIEGNLIWNTGDNGIQAAADAIIIHNAIANANGCGIYSREHQTAIPSNLRIEDNRVIASHNTAIRIIGSPNSSDAQNESDATIELIGNQLIARAGQLAIRIDNNPPILANRNFGEGSVTGSTSVASDWNAHKLSSPTLPDLDGNPAWLHLDRAQTERLFDVK